MSRKRNRRRHSSPSEASGPPSPRVDHAHKKSRRKNRRKKRANKHGENDVQPDVDGDISLPEVNRTVHHPNSRPSHQREFRSNAPCSSVDGDHQTCACTTPRSIQEVYRLIRQTYKCVWESALELGVVRESEDDMDWQPELPRPVYLVRTQEETACYREGVIQRPWER